MQEDPSEQAAELLEVKLTTEDHQHSLLVYEKALKYRIQKFHNHLSGGAAVGPSDDPYATPVEFPKHELVEAVKTRNVMKAARDAAVEKVRQSSQILRIQKLQAELHTLNVTWWDGIVQKAVDEHDK